MLTFRILKKWGIFSIDKRLYKELKDKIYMQGLKNLGPPH
jgi:hypothetical protein